MGLNFSGQLLLYKITCLAVGAVCIVLGYELFLRGFLDPASINATRGDASVEIRNAAPGIFFALFGSAIVGLTVYRGFRVNSQIASKLPERSLLIDTVVSQGKRNFIAFFDSLEHFRANGTLSELDYKFLQLQLVSLKTDFLIIAGELGNQTDTSEVGGYSLKETAVGKALANRD
ncbi:hypothetical protein GR212_15655 [Rhizobium lusitanum]|uniref:Uncharacterized protein n=1 Tax=Rhizobium lusitanum TaxID=293958 RepID=A0A6L9U6U8_9HYPH|nr:hypothetical protein [Rhizobium lusitanum]NEI71014.1 hypothetical protein [Rhizobium lusitanum]